MGAVIHMMPAVPWHTPFAQRLAAGFNRRGVNWVATSNPVRLNQDIPILLGTTFWGNIEHDGGNFILVDRCQYGDTEEWVSLARNGRGYRAEWPLRTDPSRWERYKLPLLPWKTGERVVLCGQVGTYTPDWHDERNWYESVKDRCTHFRPHPNGDNPTGLAELADWKEVKCAVVLNSSIAISTIFCGIPTIVMDRGSMAWPITGHDFDTILTPEREQWAHWLAWCQWHHEEIAEGIPWDYIPLE